MIRRLLTSLFRSKGRNSASPLTTVGEAFDGHRLAATESCGKLLNVALKDPIGADMRVTPRHAWMTTSRDGRSRVVADVMAQATSWLMEACRVLRIDDPAVAFLPGGSRRVGSWTVELKPHLVWFWREDDALHISLRTSEGDSAALTGPTSVPDSGQHALPVAVSVQRVVAP